MWKYYALLSAFFAALTAVFAKIGVKDINSDLATAIRTTVILIITWGIVCCERQIASIREVSTHTWLFLVLSGAATGLSWLFYFRNRKERQMVITTLNLSTGATRETSPVCKALK